MSTLQIIAKAQKFLAKLDRATRKSIRNSLKWVHLLLVTGLLYLCPMQLLEAMIVVILMFEIGFEFSALDRLIELNNKVRTWMLRKFSAKRRKPPC